MKANVSVAVRCRPLMGREISINRRCVSFRSADNAIIVGDKVFAFESIFDEQSSQLEVYGSCVAPLIEGCFRGLNATVFAYGQTGSGKTHSIMGALPYGLPIDPTAATTSLPPPPESEVEEIEDGVGILPRAICDVFRNVSEERVAGRVVNVRVSMVEIYNDDCRDLLHPDISPKDIIIREDRDGRIFFTGAREEAVRDGEQALFYLQQGNLNRSTAETLMNQSSSRSHAIFSMSIEVLDYHRQQHGSSTSVTPKSSSKGDGSYMQAKLHLVDLAGSERAKRTGALGTRLKESVGINQGLLSLGKVIRALTSQPITHVPYRESKLTRFLQDSLGGNSRTVMLACISSAESNLHETLSTLQYAARAKAVQNKVSANIAVGVLPVHPENELQSDMESSIVLTLRAQLEQMQADMQEMKKQGHAGDGVAFGGISYPTAVNSARHDNIHDELGSVTRGTLSRILQALTTVRTSLSALLEMVDPIFANGGGEQLQAADVQTCCALVDTCRNLHNMLADLDIEANHIAPSGAGTPDRSGILRESLRDSLQSLDGGRRFAGGGRDQEIETLRRELEECREDLKRDEDIFAEKIKELKKCKRQMKEMEAANQKSSDGIVKMRGQIKKLTNVLMRQKKQFSTLQLKAAETVCAGKTPSEDSSKRTGDAPAPPSSVTLDEEDELNISLAVAMTEPDISQLMEDLETVAREKADLEMGHQIAEEKMESFVHNTQKERAEFEKERTELLQEVQRSGEKLKRAEEDIKSLISEHRKVLEDCAAQRAAVRTAEAECERLNDALEKAGYQRQQSVEDFDEERERRKELEDELRNMKAQVVQLEQELKERAEDNRLMKLEAKQADEHLKELQDLRSANTHLKDQIMETENKQKSTFQQLTEQMTQYKNKALEAVKKLMNVEEENAKLQAQVANTATTVASAGVHRSVQAVNVDEVMAPFSTSPAELHRLQNEMEQYVQDIYHQKNLFHILSGKRKALAELSNERKALHQEIQNLMLTPENKQQLEVLRSKVSEVDRKISAMQLRKSDLEKSLEEAVTISTAPAEDSLADTVVVPSPENVNNIRLNLQSVTGALSSYYDHRGEMLDRLRLIESSRGIKSVPDFLASTKVDRELASRLMGLQDEAETLDAEIAAVASQVRDYEVQLSKRYGDEFIESNSIKSTAEIDLLHSVLKQLLEQLHAADVLKGKSSLQRLQIVSSTLLNMIAEERCKISTNDATMKQLQQQVEDKTKDYDDLVQAMQKLRRDAGRRLEQQSREAEEKIAFLLQQLRTAEAARRSLEASASAAASVAGTPVFNNAAPADEGFSSRIGTPAAEAFLNYNSNSRPSSRK